jgi:hypothetical protein
LVAASALAPSRRVCLQRSIAQGFTILCIACMPIFPRQARADGPRIVNIYNFVRNSDYRVTNSEEVLFAATQQELQLIKSHKLPATWALQYDALMNPRYQKLFKEQGGSADEIAGWWELPRPLVEKAGLKWRGAHDWDSASNIGFSPGYTPDERRKMVDVYFADFKDVFGQYPRTVGSWYIDEITLAYMVEKYGIVASCNCKDQIGTDGYTLWGGYWNQAYYPSRLNAYMPAQTRAGQIDVPIFRMLGSDPIYQYGAGPIFSLEPVYPRAGGSAQWVDWFTSSLIHQPCLAFGYTQAGQENSFGWDAIGKGLTQQVETFDRQSKAGQIRVETLADSGKWFHSNFALTPCTSVVALDDWRHENRKSVWYDSRYYRINFLWDDGGLLIRDLHRFDESLVSVTHDAVLKNHALAYHTLPIVDAGLWSTKKLKTGAFPVLLSADGKSSPMELDGPPVVKELNPTDLSITQPLRGGRSFSIVCRETEMNFTCLDAKAQPVQWAWDLIGGSKQKAAVQQVTPASVAYNLYSKEYQLRVKTDGGSCQQLEDGNIRLSANEKGEIGLLLGGF